MLEEVINGELKFCEFKIRVFTISELNIRVFKISEFKFENVAFDVHSMLGHVKIVDER